MIRPGKSIGWRLPRLSRPLKRLATGLLCCTWLVSCSPLTALSTLSPSAHYTLESDIAYGTDKRQRLDVYVPKQVDPGAPLVVFFYGGGWKDGSKEQYEFVGSALSEAGFVTVIGDYRLFPQVTFPAFVEDGARVVGWAIANAQRLGAPEGRVHLMGHSAGAHIASLLALDAGYLTVEGLDPSQVSGWIGLSGPYDFLPIESGYLVDVFPRASRSASQPINAVSSDAPPALLIHGGDDDLVEPGNSRRLAKALREAGAPVTLSVRDDVGHARTAAELALPLDFIGPVLEECTDFIAATHQAGPPP